MLIFIVAVGGATTGRHYEQRWGEFSIGGRKVEKKNGIPLLHKLQKTPLHPLAASILST
jgi:hypothetical protein